jgi:hypothetical protein
MIGVCKIDICIMIGEYWHMHYLKSNTNENANELHMSSRTNLLVTWAHALPEKQHERERK